eukprot:TRINITY_DN12408_c0_g2_i7.p1 TRINITY_DN12408_c0_g2~~TRINITY_DN12408_c0_g2_i7.p1  ORF type:complete len:572 (+),score=98.86 TRINITY_DN12408_c0_g2_i7:365-2080(+)
MLIAKSRADAAHTVDASDIQKHKAFAIEQQVHLLPKVWSIFNAASVGQVFPKHEPCAFGWRRWTESALTVVKDFLLGQSEKATIGTCILRCCQPTVRHYIEDVIVQRTGRTLCPDGLAAAVLGGQEFEAHSDLSTLISARVFRFSVAAIDGRVLPKSYNMKPGDLPIYPEPILSVDVFLDTSLLAGPYMSPLSKLCLPKLKLPHDHDQAAKQTLQRAFPGYSATLIEQEWAAAAAHNLAQRLVIIANGSDRWAMQLISAEDEHEASDVEATLMNMPGRERPKAVKQAATSGTLNSESFQELSTLDEADHVDEDLTKAPRSHCKHPRELGAKAAEEQDQVLKDGLARILELEDQIATQAREAEERLARITDSHNKRILELEDKLASQAQKAERKLEQVTQKYTDRVRDLEERAATVSQLAQKRLEEATGRQRAQIHELEEDVSWLEAEALSTQQQHASSKKEHFRLLKSLQAHQEAQDVVIESLLASLQESQSKFDDKAQPPKEQSIQLGATELAQNLSSQEQGAPRPAQPGRRPRTRSSAASDDQDEQPQSKHSKRTKLTRASARLSGKCK